MHEALIYHGEPDLGAALEAFVHASAAAHEPVLVALPGDKLQRLRGRLTGGEAETQLTDITEVAGNPACLLPVITDWLDAHDGRARVVSEALWPGRSRPEAVECLRHEALVNHALAGSPASILSPFDGEGLDADVLTGARLTHPTLLEDGARHTSDAYVDPMSLLRSDPWPLESPQGPRSEHALTGSLRDLRHAVADDPLTEALSAERRDDLVLALNEATTNAVRHGDNTCSAVIWHDDDSVVSEVACLSPVQDPLAGRRRPAPDAIDGRGLWLINHLCDLVQLRSGPAGTTVRMHMHMH